MIILIGLPGSGKSTVGRQLARRLSASFVDSDHVIEQRLGCSIREFFEREGEQAFRDVEERVIADLMASPHAGLIVPSDGEVIESRDTHSSSEAAQPTPSAATQPTSIPAALQVLSTGGGSVLREANRLALRAGGRVVYLRSSPEDLYRRLRHDQNRPLLQVGDPLQRLKELFELRDPLYQETAHFQVETGRPSVATLVNMIIMQLDLSGP